jgi:hypothetical protein
MAKKPSAARTYGATRNILSSRTGGSAKPPTMKGKSGGSVRSPNRRPNQVAKSAAKVSKLRSDRKSTRPRAIQLA